MFVITTGSLAIPAHVSISCIKSRPWEDVAVYERTPEAEAPIAAVIALCSDSTQINSDFILPVSIICAIFSTIVVCGVIGYADTTPGFAMRTASAAMWFAVSIISFGI
jgi:hypothetical protein